MNRFNDSDKSRLRQAGSASARMRSRVDRLTVSIAWPPDPSAEGAHVEQQERALAAYVDSVREQPGALAVVVRRLGGAGRRARDSDVDVYLVVDDERFAAETAAGPLRVDRAVRSRLSRLVHRHQAREPRLPRDGGRAGDDPTRASFRRTLASRGGVLARLERDARADRDACPTTCGTNGCARTSRRRGCTAATSCGRRSSATTSSCAATPACISRSPRHARPSPPTARHAGTRSTSPSWRGRPHARRVRRGVGDGSSPTPIWTSGERLIGILVEWLGDRPHAGRTLSTFIRDNELAWLRGTVPAEFW